MERIWMGIDPGSMGAVGILSDKNPPEVHDCPETIGEMRDIIKQYDLTNLIAVVEKVNPFFKSSAKSAFTFGGNFAAWQTILVCYDIPYDLVAPRVWQKSAYDSAKKLDNPKKTSFERASRLFPKISFKTKRGKILDGRSDALLIALYCKRLNP